MAQKTNLMSVANEILKQCCDVPLDFCIYLMDLRMLQLSKDYTYLAHDDFKRELINKCVNDLKGNDFSINVLKLQLFWQKKYQSRDEIKKIHHEKVFKNVLPILSDIVQDNEVNNKENFFKKIVIFVIMFAGLGSPTQQSIIKETQAALHSIFRATEVGNFINLPKMIKEQQLVEFAHLITGILLFNKDCKKGGEGLDDLPLILAQGVRATNERLHGFKDELLIKIDKLVNALLDFYIKGKSERGDCEEISLSKSFDKENLDELKTFLIYYRHIDNFLDDLIKDLEKSMMIVEKLVERLQTALIQVHNMVRYRVAVATVQVFPLFVQLSNVWVEMQEETDILSEINNNFADLTLAEKLGHTLSLELPLSKEKTNYFENEKISESPDFFSGVKLCSVSSVPSQENIQYKGFCAWTLAHTEGVLVTGNITIGILQFSNRFYSFSSSETAHKWAVNPNHYIQAVLKIAKEKIGLIKFLNLENDLIEKEKLEEDPKPSTLNAEVQTVLHPLESFIDKDYTFSEWELKLKAMKLATVAKYKTKSQQTASKSCFKTEMAVQVTPSKDASVQTVKDGYCNPSPMFCFDRNFDTIFNDSFAAHSKFTRK